MESPCLDGGVGAASARRREPVSGARVFGGDTAPAVVTGLRSLRRLISFASAHSETTHYEVQCGTFALAGPASFVFANLRIVGIDFRFASCRAETSAWRQPYRAAFWRNKSRPVRRRFVAFSAAVISPWNRFQEPLAHWQPGCQALLLDLHAPIHPSSARLSDCAPAV